jgi:uncharacterized membrane protein YidH (DUF202 family)
MSSPVVDNFLGVASNTRTKLKGVNMLVVVMAIVLSIMVIHTRNTCISERDVDKFKANTNFMNTSAIILLVMALLLFVYDIAIMFKFI